LYGAVAYAVVVAAVYIWQRHLLYLPDGDQPSDLEVESVGLRFWPASGAPYRGFTSLAASDNATGTVIVFHGNAGRAADRRDYVRALEPLGYRVVLAEYPGYGGRPGQPSEKALVSDARETVQLAYEHFGGPLFLWGESLGCGIVAAVATEPPVPVTALILLTPWDTLPQLAQTLYWYLPARWLVRDQYDNVRNLQSFKKPVALLMAERDDIIPRRHSRHLYESLSEPKRLWVFKGAGHNSWPTHPAETWWREVMDFVAAF
jgi:alpha-beta hydrolase superfamily lysophospholipase